MPPEPIIPAGNSVTPGTNDIQRGRFSPYRLRGHFFRLRNMRTEEREITTKQTIYICETCGKDTVYRHIAEDCEKIHRQPTCTHRWEYDLYCYEHDDESRASLRRTCEACLLEQEVELDDLESPQLEMVWDTIEESKKEAK